MRSLLAVVSKTTSASAAVRLLRAGLPLPYLDTRNDYSDVTTSKIPGTDSSEHGVRLVA